jgi:hypothetical protein
MGKNLASGQDLSYLEILRGALGLSVFELSLALKIRVTLLKNYLSNTSIPPHEVYENTQNLLKKMDEDANEVARELLDRFEATKTTPTCTVPTTTSEAKKLGYPGVGYCREVLALGSARSGVRFIANLSKGEPIESLFSSDKTKVLPGASIS